MTWNIAETDLQSRLFLGTAHYPSLQVMHEAIQQSESQVITVALRRQNPEKNAGSSFWDFIKNLGCHLLPNTAGCHSAKEAILTAQMARQIFNTRWIKLEVIADDYSLHPNPFELVAAAKELIQQGFQVFPYCTEDLAVCERLLEAGCRILMPWGAPIGSGKGLLNVYALKTLRQRFREVPMLIDAGLGTPSHAALALELGFDGVLLNSAVALADDPVAMAKAFALGVAGGRLAYEAGIIPERDLAKPSTTLVDRPFWHQEIIK
jgi:thiazole synthase